MRTVPLHGKTARGRVALVDDEDYDLVMGYRWSVRESGRASEERPIPYAWAYVAAVGDRKRGSVAMHNLIMGIIGVDHANGNTLDNQRSNLRPATQSENVGNSRKRLNTTSQYKGVSWNRRKSRWRAVIRAGGRTRHLGSFTSEADAALAYDAAARTAYGEFACVNFPRPGERGALGVPQGGTAAVTAPPSAVPPAHDQPGLSPYRGVQWDGGSRRWRASFRRTYGGRYESEIQAAVAYDVLASAALGEAADLNFPGGLDRQTKDRLFAEAGVTVEAIEAAVGRGRSGGLKARWSQREAVTHVCEQCGSEYLSRATNASRYCGRSCQDRVNAERNRQIERERYMTREGEAASQAARIYAGALESGSTRLTDAVAAGLGCNRTRAWLLIRAARDLGLLGGEAA